ncbi:MAG TPA: hypothetical protein VGO67_01585 [Verrucomicrobiae bacterium]
MRDRSAVTKAAYTFIELLAGIFIVMLATVAFDSVNQRYGIVMGIVAATAGGAAGLGIVALLYRRAWKRKKAQLEKLRADYQRIYKVLKVSDEDQSNIMLEGAEIRAGDYGWEAPPLEKNGLIYLHGLTPEWRTVWHAGFSADQIEYIGQKPSSQYDHWVPYWVKTSQAPCPFPIQARLTPSMGIPHHSGRYFEAYPQSLTGKMVKLKKSPKNV